MKTRGVSWFFVVGALAAQLAFPVDARAGEPPACDGGIGGLRPGSTFDYGWSGLFDDQEMPTGVSFDFAIASRCSDDSSPCDTNADCGNSDCDPTCDCVSDQTCEIKGPVGTKRCLATFAECMTNADCPASINCLSLTGPPIPISADANPLCVIGAFDAPLEGSADMASGDVELSTSLRWRLYLGIASDKPCPTCGAPEDTPELGDVFTCSGGGSNGSTCTVDGVSPLFGGVSFDCPPSAASSVTTAGIAIRLNELTTGTTARTAQLPCGNASFISNPLNASGKCLDDETACTSNSDCLRCSADPATHCTNNGDCTGKGTCAAAPDQPISCGYWCHCGFCNGDPALPCFESSECPGEQTCQKGPGSPSSASAQQKPNDCSADANLCGTEAPDQCEMTDDGRCSDEPYRGCESNADCENFNAGTCEIGPRSCFGNRIERTGAPSPLGNHCVVAGDSCTTNGDCDGGDECGGDVMTPSLGGLVCSGASSTSFVNTAIGITGPGAVDWKVLLKICRCADPAPECEQFCATPSQCDSLPGGSACDDGDPCTTGETCSGSDCTGGEPVNCNDNVDCNGAETCSPGVGCVDGTPTCNDANPCTDDVCNEGMDDCLFPPNSQPCNDGLFCNGADTCAAGTCSQHAGDPCDGADGDGDCSETCSEQSDDCTANDEDGEVCDDGNSATSDDECQDGQCVAGAEPAVCGDANENGSVQTSDALRALQKSVGQDVSCPVHVCDVNSNGQVQTSDALAILRKSVGQNVVLTCPAQV